MYYVIGLCFSLADHICDQFRAGQIHGDFCPAFCDGGLVPLGCGNFHSNKEVVFKATWKGVGVYVKGQLAARPQIPLRSGQEHSALPSKSDFARTVDAYLRDNVGIKVHAINTEIMYFIILLLVK